MGLFGRRRAQAATGAPTGRAARREELDEARRHLDDFVRTRVGVEAFIEPATQFIPPTVLLVATTGEWTRRRAPERSLVDHLARDLNVPVYDVRLVGYPPRMRAWNERLKEQEKAEKAARSRPADLPPWGAPE